MESLKTKGEKREAHGIAACLRMTGCRYSTQVKGETILMMFRVLSESIRIVEPYSGPAYGSKTADKNISGSFYLLL